MTPRLPDFVVIGAQKAGSTVLLNSIRQHRDAWMPAAEQAYFRDPVYGNTSAKEFAGLYAGRTERRLGLKCPDYLARPEVPARLREDLGTPDLVVCLRDPVARAVSAFYWRIRWGLLPVMSVEEGLWRLLHGGLREHDPTVGEVLDWGRYGQHLERYLEHFPRERLLVLVDADLRSQPDATMNDVYRFLGLVESGAVDVGGRGSNEGVYSATRLRFLQRRARLVLRWDHDRTYPSIPPTTRTDLRLQEFAVAGIDRVLLARIFGNRKPSLSAELEDALRAWYRDDVRRVERIVCRELGWADRQAGVPTMAP